MKAETLRKYYRGPTTVALPIPMFQWTSRARAWPRRSYFLWFNPSKRRFLAHFQTHHSRRGQGPITLIMDESEIAGIVSLLSATQVAMCTAASIEATRDDAPLLWVSPGIIPGIVTVSSTPTRTP